MIVDTHVHTASDWYEPAATLLAQMDRCRVDRAWLVQLLGIYDNSYQQACAAAHPDRFDSIVQVDWTQADATGKLRDLAERGARGVRLRPVSRSPGDDPLAIWHAAHRLGLIVSCVGTAAQFTAPEFAALLRALPRLDVVLEHLGGLARPDAGDVAIAKSRVFDLALHPGVSLKVPGLGQLNPRSAFGAPPSDPGDSRGSLIAEALGAFGAGRLLWGSDFPVVSSREGYGNALEWTRAACPPESRAAIFGGNAAALLARQS